MRPSFLHPLPSFLRRQESIAKIQLERLRISALYRCFNEFYKGPIKQSEMPCLAAVPNPD